MSSSKTALLIFTRTAASEARHKSLLNKGATVGQNLVLANELIAKTKYIAAQSGLDIIISTDFNQKGSTFGKRLSTAIQETFGKGYEKVIAIGTDTPALTVSHIKQAVESLKNQKLVIGPSADGGVYLIGMHRNSFCKSTFESLPWLTGSVFSALVSLANSSGQSAVSLQVLTDVDDLGSLCKAITELSATDVFCKLALKLLTIKVNLLLPNHPLPLLYNGLPVSMRAPPYC